MVNEIITGDAFELVNGVSDNSVGLILCDPVYWEYGHYRLVAECALRCLLPGRSAIAQAGDEHRLRAEVAMQAEGLIAAPLIMEKMTGGIRQLWNTRSLASYKPYLRVIRTGAPAFGWMPTLIAGRGRDKSLHVWGDTGAVFAHAIVRLTEVGDIVLDPFTGSGLVPALCKHYNRQYIGFEIDPKLADVARGRIANVPPQLPGLVQQEIFDD